MLNSFDKPRNIFLDLFIVVTVSGVVLFILNIINPSIFKGLTNPLEEKNKEFYYIDEFINDLTTYRSNGKELWNEDGIMSERVAREMNVIMALGNSFYNVPTDRNSEMIVKITDKDDYHIKKQTIANMEHGLPYLVIIETFDTNHYNLQSYLEKDTRFVVANKRRRDYWKKTWVNSDEKGNNTFLFENPIYATQDEYNDEFKQESTPTKNDKYYELYPHKAYVTFTFDKDSVLSNKGYLIKFEEVNPLKQKFTYNILIDDQKLQEYYVQIK